MLWTPLESRQAAAEGAPSMEVTVGSLGLRMHRKLEHGASVSAAAAAEADPAASYEATFGSISFGSPAAAAQYATVPMAVEPHRLERLAIDGWGLSRPSLILSIVGSDEHTRTSTSSGDGKAGGAGALAASIAPEVEAACAAGLGVLAQKADAWIISGGFDGGASAVAGQAMAVIGQRAAAARAPRSVLLAVAPLPSVKYHERFLPDYRQDGSFWPRQLERWTLEAVDAGLCLVSPGRTRREVVSVESALEALARSTHAPTRAAAAALQREDAEHRLGGAGGLASWAVLSAFATGGGAIKGGKGGGKGGGGGGGGGGGRHLTPWHLKQALAHAINRLRAARRDVRYVAHEASGPKRPQASARGTVQYDGSGHALEPHHTHFILVDCPEGGGGGGEAGGGGGEAGDGAPPVSAAAAASLKLPSDAVRASLEDVARGQGTEREVPYVCVCMGGGDRAYAALARSLKAGCPVLVVGESGGCAAAVARLVEA